MAVAEKSPLEQCAEMLEGSGEYRVLRRVKPPNITQRCLKEGERIAIVLDTETTGLDARRDEVIELAMVAFVYDASGMIVDAIGQFDCLNQPRHGVPQEITRLTGITTEMLEGHAFDDEEIESFVSPAALIIAHNASFDRPFCEKTSSIFSNKAWADTVSEIPWSSIGYEGTKLIYLLNQSGFYYESHRAYTDTFALFNLLNHRVPQLEMTVFQCLLRSARSTRTRLWIRGSYEVRRPLKQRGYRWHAGGGMFGRAWCKDFDDSELVEEEAFLEASAVDPEDVARQRLNAFTRYKEIL